MNREEPESAYDRHMQELEQEEQARKQQRREENLAITGPFDPWTFLELAGFSTSETFGKKHAFMKHPTNPDMSFSIADGAIFEKPKSIRVEVGSRMRADHESGKTKKDFFQPLQHPDEVFGLLENFYNMKLSPTQKEELERKYVIKKIQQL